jgi:hypothetical protein
MTLRLSGAAFRTHVQTKMPAMLVLHIPIATHRDEALPLAPFLSAPSRLRGQQLFPSLPFFFFTGQAPGWSSYRLRRSAFGFC